MNLHEYQGKQLFAEYGLPVSKGYAVDTPKEATEAADMIGGDIWVVKAQVHAGGRGKAGGVKLVKSKEEIAAFAKQWLGNKLVTYQTDENGQPVSKILVESCTDIAEELYLGAVVDRSSRRIVFMASTEGGVEIEKVAEETPDKILRATIDPLVGAQPYQGRELAFNLGLKGDQIKQFVKIFMGLSQMFVEKDLALIEVNPLVITDQGNLHCLDAKIGVDGNALYRQGTLRSVPGRCTGGPRRPVGVELRGPGRQHRLHGQRCRPGHGHYGHCRPAWRLPRQLPRRGWWRHLQNHPV
jgi:succinyl-CoA synthetase beta subunit